MFGSGGVPESVTVATLGYAPAAVAVSTNVTVACAPLARVPTVQVIGLAVVTHVTVFGFSVTEFSVIPVASKSESATALAGNVPLLKTVMV